MTNKKYTLKPGRHQFAPHSPAVHDNKNTSDQEAEWYPEKYPHIKTLFVVSPGTRSPDTGIPDIKHTTSHPKIVITENNEDLSAAN